MTRRRTRSANYAISEIWSTSAHFTSARYGKHCSSQARQTEQETCEEEAEMSGWFSPTLHQVRSHLVHWGVSGWCFVEASISRQSRKGCRSCHLCERASSLFLLVPLVHFGANLVLATSHRNLKSSCCLRVDTSAILVTLFPSL